jgi:hypothetical protein
MVKIDKTEFGKIIIDGRAYDYDVKILPSGKILQRFGPKGSHEICLEEFAEIMKEKPKIIVIGTGQSGVAELEADAKKEIESKGIKLIIEPTPKAIKSFNEAAARKAGLFHLTC